MTTGRLQYQREALTIGFLTEIRPLLERHIAETSMWPDMPLELDLSTYAAAEAAGVLRVYTARERGVLVGYAIMSIMRHPHFSTSLQAHTNALYMDPSARGIPSKVFIGWCDTELAHEGVAAVYHSVSPRKDYSGLLRSLGYDLHETVYARRIS